MNYFDLADKLENIGNISTFGDLIELVSLADRLMSSFEVEAENGELELSDAIGSRIVTLDVEIEEAYFSLLWSASRLRRFLTEELANEMKRKAAKTETALRDARETVGGRPYCGQDDHMADEARDLRSRANRLEDLLQE